MHESNDRAVFETPRPSQRRNWLIRSICCIGRCFHSIAQWITNQYLVGTNVLGVVLLLVPFGVTLFVFGDTLIDEGLQLAAGIVVLIVDLSWRRMNRNRLTTYLERGGTLIFIPMWIWGVIWIVGAPIKLLIE